MCFLPGRQTGQQALGLVLVADEVVIHDKKGTPKSRGVHVIDLPQELLRILGSGFAAEQLGNIAELAIEGATPGELQGHAFVEIDIDQIEARQRSQCQIRFTLGPVYMSGLAPLPIPQELRQGIFGLIQNEVIHPFDRLERRGRIGSPRDHRRGELLTQRHHLVEGLLLNNHGGQKDDVRPFDILPPQIFDIHIHQFQLELFGQHARHGHQPQGRQQGFLSDKGKGVLVAPVCSGNTR